MNKVNTEHGARQHAIMVILLLKSMVKSSCPAFFSCFSKCTEKGSWIEGAEIAKGCESMQRLEGKGQKTLKILNQEVGPSWDVENVGGRNKETQTFPEYKDEEIKGSAYKTVKRKYILYNA